MSQSVSLTLTLFRGTSLGLNHPQTPCWQSEQGSTSLVAESAVLHDLVK